MSAFIDKRQCSYCSFTLDTPLTASNAKRHLERKHRELLPEFLTMNVPKTLKRVSNNCRPGIIKQLVRYFARTSVPLSHVEDDDFKVRLINFKIRYFLDFKQFNTGH